MSSQNIESVLVEERSFPPSTEFTARARVKPATLKALHAEAAADTQGFWARQAQNELRWHKPFTVTLDESQRPNYRWFTDGELNVSLQLPRRAPRGARPQDRRDLRGEPATCAMCPTASCMPTCAGSRMRCSRRA
jgi:hypothetical protein